MLRALIDSPAALDNTGLVFDIRTIADLRSTPKVPAPVDVRAIIERFTPHGIPGDDAIDWHTHGFTPQSASVWRSAGFQPGDAADWADNGFTDPADTTEWRRHGWTGEHADRALNSGLTIPPDRCVRHVPDSIDGQSVVGWWESLCQSHWAALLEENPRSWTYTSTSGASGMFWNVPHDQAVDEMQARVATRTFGPSPMPRLR